MRATQAQSQLPADVNNYGITVQKTVTAPLMLMTLYSPNGTYDATVSIELRLHQFGGPNHAIVWHRKCADFRCRAVRDAAVGEAGPVGEAGDYRAGNCAGDSGAKHGESRGAGWKRAGAEGAEFTYSVRAQGRLTSRRRNLARLWCADADKRRLCRVRDVARIELGCAGLQRGGRFNGKPGAIMALYQLPGSNAVQAAGGCEEIDGEVKGRFPHDIDYVMSLDTTLAVTEGMKEIIETLVIAILLVIIVVYIFLQGWRATLIPLLAVPVSLDRHVYFVPGVWIFGEHAVVVWIGAGDWIGGGRRDRRGGGG